MIAFIGKNFRRGYDSTCSSDRDCDTCINNQFISLHVESYDDIASNYTKIKKIVEKIRMKDPLESIKRKKNWKAIQEEHRRR